MHIKPKAWLIFILCVILIGGIVAGIVFLKSKEQTLTEKEQSAETQSSETEVVVAPPSEESNEPEETEDSEVLIPIAEETDEESEELPVEETLAKPEKEVTPKMETVTEKSVQIGSESSPETEAYSCGVSGHHCSCAEVHALISNYELEGCPYCGSHTCPSFYATDEWGQTCYDATKCPKYNVKNDPVYYCQDCGKKCGDGQNGTCAIYNIDIDCPYCGEHVKAWSCHSCN